LVANCSEVIGVNLSKEGRFGICCQMWRFDVELLGIYTHIYFMLMSILVLIVDWSHWAAGLNG